MPELLFPFAYGSQMPNLERVAALVDAQARDEDARLVTVLSAMLALAADRRIEDSAGGFVLTVHQASSFDLVCGLLRRRHAGGRRPCYRVMLYLRPGWLERIYARGWGFADGVNGIVLDADPVPGEVGERIYRVVTLERRQGCALETKRGFGIEVAGKLLVARSVDAVRRRARRCRRGKARAVL